MIHVEIQGCPIGPGHPAFIIAEMSANHCQDFDQAVKIIEAAKESGADAIKLQTYTPDTLTIDCNSDLFRIKGSVWAGKTLYELYGEAFMPWEWQPKLKEIADSLGLVLFSTPFDETSVDFLEQMNVSAHKVASFELVDIPLLRKIAATGKPVIMSTGMASLKEIDEAVETVRLAGGKGLALLKCTSAYPAPAEEMNLKTIPDLAARYRVPVGLSDHTMGIVAPIVSIVQGACIIEKHFTLSRSTLGPDSSFSMEPHEFRSMADAVHEAEKSLGKVSYEITEKQQESRALRRSLFVVEDIRQGESFTIENVRSIRPAKGMHTRHYDEILGKKAVRDIARGEPLSWDLVQ